MLVSVTMKPMSYQFARYTFCFEATCIFISRKQSMSTPAVQPNAQIKIVTKSNFHLSYLILIASHTMQCDPPFDVVPLLNSTKLYDYTNNHISQIHTPTNTI